MHTENMPKCGNHICVVGWLQPTLLDTETCTKHLHSLFLSIAYPHIDWGRYIPYGNIGCQVSKGGIPTYSK